MKKVLVIIGTRPEAIKLAPVVHALQQASERFETKICDTGQHRALKQPILDFFQLHPDFQLNALGANTSLAALTAYLLTQIDHLIENFQPDFVIVQGDTASALAGAWAGFYRQKRVVHVEAGLRTYDLSAPFPEEMNRQVIARLAAVHFAPTELAVQHLRQEGIPPDRIHLVGNPVIDALQVALAKIKEREPDSVSALRKQLEGFQQQYEKMLLITLHRRENLQQHLPAIGKALRNVLTQNNCFALFPVHPNPGVQAWAARLAIGLPNLYLAKPLPYETFVWAMQQSDLILTDSGGIQEEAPSLGKPVVVLRTTTERPEAQQGGIVHRVSLQSRAIETIAMRLLALKESPLPPSRSPFGDGKSAGRILAILDQIR